MILHQETLTVKKMGGLKLTTNLKSSLCKMKVVKIQEYKHVGLK